MKKVLVLTYFFPPGNFAGSFRAASWAEHFHAFGLYPIIVTRHWDEGQSGFSDISENKEVQVIRSEHSEIHYLPYTGNRRDRILRKGPHKLKFLRRFLSLWEIVMQNFFTGVIPFRNLYHYSKKLLRDQPDIDTVIITAKPFILFRFGWLLKKHFPYIRWIADYRDPWNTHEYQVRQKNAFIRTIEQRSEKKWVASASLISSVSELWCKKLEDFTGRKAYVVYNGYDNTLEAAAKNYTFPEKKSVLTIGYNGSLYQMQHVDHIIGSILKVLDSCRRNLKISFWGINNDPAQAERLRNMIKGYEPYFEFTGRLARDVLHQELLRADLFLIFGITELKGCYPVKLFDYMAAGKPILISPSGNDVAEALIKETNAGFVCETANDVEKTLMKLYDDFFKNGTLNYNANKEKIVFYSRKNQAMILAEIILNSISDSSKENNMKINKTP